MPYSEQQRPNNDQADTDDKLYPRMSHVYSRHSDSFLWRPMDGLIVKSFVLGEIVWKVTGIKATEKQSSLEVGVNYQQVDLILVRRDR